MKRKQIVILGGGLAMCIGVMLVLYAGSPMSKEIYRGGFERRFVGVTSLKAAYDLGVNSYYIAGITVDKIYLGNYTAPFHLLVSDLQLVDTQRVTLSVKKLSDGKRLRAFRVKIDSPYFFLVNGEMPGLFRGMLNQWEATRFMPSDSAYFAEAVPIGPSSFVLRSYSSRTESYELAREVSYGSLFDFNYDLLEKQIDGLFCVDGLLHYNSEINRVVYLYAYRNEFIVMDTNLNLVNRFHTVDTFSHARITVANIESKNYSMLSAPPAIINGNSCVFRNKLFVRSNILSKNEDAKVFRGNSVIDVYNLKEGMYLYSFYIENYESHRISEFRILDENQVVAVFDRYLVLYNYTLDL